MKKKYKILKLPKGNGKFRIIYAPKKEYKSALKKINTKIKLIFKKEEKHKVNHAFINGRNCVTNASKHVGFNYTLSMDLTDFFDSVQPYMVSDYLKQEYLDLCFIDGIARQGLPTSPIVANLAFLKADNELLISLTQLLGRGNFAYTRYADDLTISFQEKELVGDIIRIVNTIVEKNGFQVNKSKTKIQDSKNGRRIITGVGVDDEVHPTRKILKKIRAAKHQENKKSLDGLVEWSKCKKPKYMENAKNSVEDFIKKELNEKKIS